MPLICISTAALKDVMKMIATRKNIKLEDNDTSAPGTSEAARASGGGKSTRRALGNNFLNFNCRNN